MDTVKRLMKLDHEEFKFALQTYKTLALTKHVLVAGVLLLSSKKKGGGVGAASAKSAFGGDVFSFAGNSGQGFAAPATGNRRRGGGRGRWRANAHGSGGGGGWRGRGESRGSGRPCGVSSGTERVYQHIGNITTTKLPSLLSLRTEFIKYAFPKL